MQSRQGGTPSQMRNILVPTDFSPAAFQALQQAIGFADQHGAVITLFHVVDLNLHTPPVGPADADKLRSDLWKEARVKLGQLAMGAACGKVEVRTLIREGLPAEVIAEEARAHDLIVIGKQEGKRFWRLFSRRTVEALFKSVPRPLLVVREQQEGLGTNQNQV